MQTTSADQTTTDRRWHKSKDDYGRTVRYVEEISPGTRVALGAIVGMPKVYKDEYPGQNYLTNEWNEGENGRGRVTYHETLKAAYAVFGVGNKEFVRYPQA